LISEVLSDTDSYNMSRSDNFRISPKDRK